MSFIRVDYEAAMAQARKIEQAAEECDSAISAVRQQIGNSESIWQGESGDALREKLSVSLQEISNAKSQLLAAAGAIRVVAEQLLEEDSSLASRFV